MSKDTAYEESCAQLISPENQLLTCRFSQIATIKTKRIYTFQVWSFASSRINIKRHLPNLKIIFDLVLIFASLLLMIAIAFGSPRVASHFLFYANMKTNVNLHQGFSVP